MTAFGRIGSRCVVRPRAGYLGAVGGRYDHRPGSIGARRRGMVDSCAGTAGEGLPSTYRAGSSSHERSEEHTSELQSLMRISYAVLCLKQKKHIKHTLHRSE